MTENPDHTGTPSAIHWRPIGWSLAGGLLLLPLIAMRFTDEVQWTWADFVFAAVLIGGIGGAFELAVRFAPDRTGLPGYAVALAGTFLMLWINAAVGIIGSADNDANILYALVLMIGILVGATGGFRPPAMQRALIAVLLAQLGVTAIAAVLGLGEPVQGILHLAAVNGFFMVFWLLALVLFHRSEAARSGASDDRPR